MREWGGVGGLQSHILIDPELQVQIAPKCQVVSALNPAQGVPDSLTEDMDVLFLLSLRPKLSFPPVIILHLGPCTKDVCLLPSSVFCQSLLTLPPPPERFPGLLWLLPNILFLKIRHLLLNQTKLRIAIQVNCVCLDY